MDKSSHKCIGNQSNQRTSIYRHVKVKRPNNLQQQSYQNKEAEKINAIMEKLGNFDVNGHGRNRNINHFVPLFVSNNEEGANPSPKPKNNPVVVLSEDEDKDEKKG